MISLTKTKPNNNKTRKNLKCGGPAETMKVSVAPRQTRDNYAHNFWFGDDVSEPTPSAWPAVEVVAPPCPFSHLRVTYGDAAVEVIKRTPSKGILGYFFDFSEFYSYIDSELTQLELATLLISHALRMKLTFKWLNKPVVVSTRHHTRFGEEYRESIIRVNFEFNRTRYVYRNDHVVAPSLNGSNGEWTGMDDLAAPNGAARQARINNRNRHAAAPRHQGAVRAPQIVPPGALCKMCQVALLQPVPVNFGIMFHPQRCMFWNCGCMTCAGCFTEALNEHIVTLRKKVSTVSCSDCNVVSSCKLSVILDEQRLQHILPVGVVPYWQDPNMAPVAPPGPVPPPLLPNIQARELYIADPASPAPFWERCFGWTGVSDASIRVLGTAPTETQFTNAASTLAAGGMLSRLAVPLSRAVSRNIMPVLNCAVEKAAPLMEHFVSPDGVVNDIGIAISMAGIAGAVGMGVYSLCRVAQNWYNTETVEDVPELMGMETEVPVGGRIINRGRRDGYMTSAGYKHSTVLDVYEAWAQRMLPLFAHKVVSNDTGRVILFRLHELNEKHVADGGLPADPQVLLNTAIYASQCCEMMQLKIGRFSAVQTATRRPPSAIF